MGFVFEGLVCVDIVGVYEKNNNWYVSNFGFDVGDSKVSWYIIINDNCGLFLR